MRVQVETARPDFSGGELLEKYLALHKVVGAIFPLGALECADVTVPLFVLHFLELLDQVISALLETGITRGAHTM